MVMVATRQSRLAESFQGPPTRARPLANDSGDPGPATRGTPCSSCTPLPPWKDPVMAAKPKNENADETREQARRAREEARQALQVSLDTRQ